MKKKQFNNWEELFIMEIASQNSQVNKIYSILIFVIQMFSYIIIMIFGTIHAIPLNAMPFSFLGGSKNTNFHHHLWKIYWHP